MKQKESGSDIIYISHGGGPLPVLGEASHAKMVAFLRNLAAELRTPEEILVVSAHWEEEVPTVYSAKDQGLLFDYFGFPPEAYTITYPTRENPGLVSALQDAFGVKRIPVEVNESRGLDHGVFIPLMLMYPDGGIPVTQLSLQRGLNPSKHLEIGHALRPLLERNLLVIGSGFSFHNMSQFMIGGTDTADPVNNEFQNWLIRICTEADSVDDRNRKLENWKGAPGADYCHPREEHLMPLHVCAGLTDTNAKLVFDDFIAGKRAVGFHWSDSTS